MRPGGFTVFVSYHEKAKLQSLNDLSPFSVPNPRSILPEPTGGGLADTWDDAGMRAYWMSCGSRGMLCSHMTRNGFGWLGSLGF